MVSNVVIDFTIANYTAVLRRLDATLYIYKVLQHYVDFINIEHRFIMTTFIMYFKIADCVAPRVIRLMYISAPKHWSHKVSTWALTYYDTF